MIKLKSLNRIIPIAILFAGILLLSACSIRDKVANPSDWGYDCTVSYDALGGTINSREHRETYYMKNSYVFKPSGTTNMLIEPVKDGYILAGWYTAKEDIKDANGNITGYSFKAEDRWDFDLDRVQNNMTLYARWIPQGKVQYVDASTGDIMFSKNITVDSPVQELSSAAAKLIDKKGYTFYGYYSDSACTAPYDFSAYTHQALVLSNQEVYEKLYEEFPQYIKKIEYVKPSENEEENLEEDTSDLFINQMGYEIATDDEKARAKIRAKKDEIFEEAIRYYLENTANKVVYLKYLEGNYARITNVDDLKREGKYGFTGLDKSGNPIDGYIIAKDIDFHRVVLEMTESFSGKIYGNGHSLKNILINVSSKKLDHDTSKSAGLFMSLDGAYLENIKFENMSIKLSVNSGIPVTVGSLAVQASNTQLKDIQFTDLTITTGKGDDGNAAYRIGDLFAKQRNNKLENVTGNNVTISASEFAQLNLVLTSEDEQAQKIAEP